MKIGFTGTQEGLTKHQQNILYSLFTQLDIDEFHEGDCIGADANAAIIAFTFGIYIVSHPPINTSKRAFCERFIEINESREPKEYLVRNQDIVDETELLIACPKEFEEQLRSGTWATIRRARKKKMKLIIIFPNGTTKRENL